MEIPENVKSWSKDTIYNSIWRHLPNTKDECILRTDLQALDYSKDLANFIIEDRFLIENLIKMFNQYEPFLEISEGMLEYFKNIEEK